MSPEFSLFGLVYIMAVENVGGIVLLGIISPYKYQFPWSNPFLVLYMLWLLEMWGVSHF